MCSQVLRVFGLTTGYVDILPYWPEGMIVLLLVLLTLPSYLYSLSVYHCLIKNSLNDAFQNSMTMWKGFYTEIPSECHVARGRPSKHVDLRQTIPRTLTDLGGFATANSSMRIMCERPSVLFLRQTFEGYTRDMNKRNHERPVRNPWKKYLDMSIH